MHACGSAAATVETTIVATAAANEVIRIIGSG